MHFGLREQDSASSNRLYHVGGRNSGGQGRELCSLENTLGEKLYGRSQAPAAVNLHGLGPAENRGR